MLKSSSEFDKKVAWVAAIVHDVAHAIVDAFSSRAILVPVAFVVRLALGTTHVAGREVSEASTDGSVPADESSLPVGPALEGALALSPILGPVPIGWVAAIAVIVAGAVPGAPTSVAVLVVGAVPVVVAFCSNSHELTRFCELVELPFGTGLEVGELVE